MATTGREDKLKAVYEKFEKDGLFEGDDDEGLKPSEAIKEKADRRPGDTPRVVVDCANRILQFYGLCVREMGLRRSEVIAAIELATMTAYNDPNSRLTPEQVNKAREYGAKLYGE